MWKPEDILSWFSPSSVCGVDLELRSSGLPSGILPAGPPRCALFYLLKEKLRSGLAFVPSTSQASSFFYKTVRELWIQLLFCSLTK